MHIELTENNDVVIAGNIKSVEDSIHIKDTINTLLAQGSRSIQLRILSSLSLTSTAIGFLMKIVQHDKVQVSVAVGDQRLYTLLEELCLLERFNVRLLGN